MQLLSKIKQKYLIYITLTLIVSASVYMGFEYSAYNQDYHHSFFILSMYIDSQNNFDYFKDIFLQYGPGQLIFYNLIDSFIEINIVTISNINVVIYAINLVILFKIFEKVSNIQAAFILISLIFLVHPFSIYPWPDYLSGLCLSLFFYFFLNNENRFTIFLCSTFLFLAIFFRSTYIINILFSIILYLFFFYFLKKKIIINKIIILLIFFISIFFIALINFESLSLWFSQSLGIIGNYAEDTKHTDLYDKISKYIGRNGFVFLKICYFLLRSIINLFDFTNIYNLIFIFCIVINLFFIFKVFKKRLEITNDEKKILFISILGLSGFVQSLMLFEIFRNINATMGIFISSIYLYENRQVFFLFINKYLKVFFIIMGVYLIILLNNFSYQNYDDENYTTFENLYFSNSKKIKSPIKEYYEDLNNYLCKFKNFNLINVSNDFAISYICTDKFIKNKSSYYPFILKLIKPEEYKRIIIEKNLKNNEIFLSNEKIIHKNIRLIKKFKTFHEHDWHRDIYLYKNKN